MIILVDASISLYHIHVFVNTDVLYPITFSAPLLPFLGRAGGDHLDRRFDDRRFETVRSKSRKLSLPILLYSVVEVVTVQ